MNVESNAITVEGEYINAEGNDVNVEGESNDVEVIEDDSALYIVELMVVEIKEFKKVDSTFVLIVEIVDDKVNVDDIDSLFVLVSSLLLVLGLLLGLSQELVSKSLLSKPDFSILILQVSGILSKLN